MQVLIVVRLVSVGKEGGEKMKKISVIGAGYVGLVTGVCFSEVGHQVQILDIDEAKITDLQKGKSPIYEPELATLLRKNLDSGRLHFTSTYKQAMGDVEAVFIAVGTPQCEDGSADLSYVYQAAKQVASTISKDTVVVMKSTVPVGTNEAVKEMIRGHLLADYKVDVVSCPEFLREGSAIKDMFHGDRVVIGAEEEGAAKIVQEIYEAFQIPVMHTDIRSAEMIKYASNAFLATKISFINEISSICEKLGANVEDVALGMGKDSRIGEQFLQAGIGYGGSCFPKDTKALVQIAGNVEHKFDLLESVIHVNNRQQVHLVHRAKQRLGELKGRNATVLGLAFKPNTDDIREAASIVIAQELLLEGAHVTAYDPAAMEQAKKVLPIQYASSGEEALSGADVVFIVTEWDEFKKLSPSTYEKYMHTPVVFDGRNCYPLSDFEEFTGEYHSIGRPSVGKSLTYSHSYDKTSSPN